MPRIVFKRWRSLALFLAIAALSVAAVLLFGSSTRRNASYMVGEISRGSIEKTISSTGTLGPVTQVEVGTQVSGIVDRILVDFNDRVRTGQVIAVLDTGLLKLAVADAQAGYQRSEAQLEEAQANYDRAEELLKKGLSSRSEFQSVKTSLKSAQAASASAGAALDRARQNLTYAIIRAPIDGTVTARNVEAGQTVAASFSTPTLFVIARDLSKMEIKAQVDEGDIGEIRQGQDVRFTVQAFPSRTFTGKVKQVRVQPTTSANVVHYTVVISADNRDLVLLPGMTATVDVIVDARQNVLRAPNAALRFRPSEEELRDVPPPGPPPGDSTRTSGPFAYGTMPPLPPDRSPGGVEGKVVWIQDGGGTIRPEPVRLGLSDGSMTEIDPLGKLAEGTPVITGTSTAAKKTRASSSNRMQGGPPGPPPF